MRQECASKSSTASRRKLLQAFSMQIQRYTIAVRDISDNWQQAVLVLNYNERTIKGNASREEASRTDGKVFIFVSLQMSY